jgi:hypothetical protein
VDTWSSGQKIGKTKKSQTSSRKKVCETYGLHGERENKAFRPPRTLPLNDENLSKEQLAPRHHVLAEQLAWFLSEKALSTQG